VVRIRRVLALTLFTVLALAACSSDSDGGASSTSTTTTIAGGTSTTAASSTSTTAAAGSSTTAVTPPATPCTGGRVARPASAVAKAVPDVDGDGRADEGWIAEADDGTVTVGIDTAAGGGFTTPFESASPVMRSVLVVDVDEQGPVELLFDDGRLVRLYAVSDCQIVPVTNPEGETYTFGLGFTDVGTGVGCVDTPDGRRLAGLDVTSDEGDTVAWSRTVVELDGTKARNGATEEGTFTRPADDAAIALLRQVTCGDLTTLVDGLNLDER